MWEYLNNEEHGVMAMEGFILSVNHKIVGVDNISCIPWPSKFLTSFEAKKTISDP